MELTAILAVGVLLAVAACAPAIAMKMHFARRLREEYTDHRSRIQRIETESPDARFSIGEDGTILSFNPAAECLFGYTASEIIGDNISRLLPAASASSGDGPALNKLHTAPRVRGGIGVEVSGLRKDGTSVPLALILSEQTGRRRRVFRAVARDISDRQLAEVQESRLQMLDGLLACVGAPVAVLDTEGRLVRCNPAFASLVQYRETDVEGRFYWELLLNPEDWGRTKVAVAHIIASGEPERSRIVWRTRDGEQLAMAVAITALRAGNSPASHAAMVAFPIHEIAPDDHFGATTMQAIEQLAGGIARQFNDLLTSINGYSELLLGSSQIPDSARKDIEEIKRAGERAASLTQQLLVFSGKQPMAPVTVNVNDMVSSMIPMLRMLMGDRIQVGSVLDLSSPAGTTVEADPGWLEQVMLNLAVNAREAMPDGGKLTIETSIQDMDVPTARRVAKLPAGKYVVLTVTDTGLGMDAVTHARAFEPFFTNKRSKAMGLGLSTVYGVVRQSGGNVVLQSIPGSGTSVRIFLPHREAVAKAEDAVQRGLFLVRGAGA